MLTTLVKVSAPFLDSQVPLMVKLFSAVSVCPIKELRVGALEVLNTLLVSIVKHRMQSEQKQQVKKMCQYLLTYVINEAYLPRLEDVHLDVQKQVLLAIKTLTRLDNFQVLSQ